MTMGEYLPGRDRPDEPVENAMVAEEFREMISISIK